MLASSRNGGRDEAPDYATGPLDLIGPTLWRLANGLPEPERERKARSNLSFPGEGRGPSGTDGAAGSRPSPGSRSERAL